MSYDARELTALTSANGFTLWHYRTDDDRAAVTAPGYFAAAEPPLLPGDIIIVIASDATALVPVRGRTATGSGVTLASFGGSTNLLRSATLRIDVAASASATARALILDAVPGVVDEFSTQAIGADVTGPIVQVTFSLRDALGANAVPAQTVPVSAGRASATFTMPAAGSDYRYAVSETADPSLSDLSDPFLVAPLPRLLAETGGRLLLETGGALIA